MPVKVRELYGVSMRIEFFEGLNFSDGLFFLQTKLVIKEWESFENPGECYDTAQAVENNANDLQKLAIYKHQVSVLFNHYKKVLENLQ